MDNYAEQEIRAQASVQNYCAMLILPKKQEVNMDFLKLNPVVRAVSLYEKLNRKDECIAYDCRIIYVVSGDLSVTAGGEKLGHMSPGHLVFIPAGTPYKLKGQYFRAVAIAFDLTDDTPTPEGRISPVTPEQYDPALCHKADDPAPFDKVIHLDDMESQRDNLVKMAGIFTASEGHFRAELSARLKLILLRLAESAEQNALPARMVEALDEYIRENINDEISNTEIGAIFGYHPFYVSRVLKDTKGQTLRQYIISYRLKLAKSMLELTDKSVAEIGDECGFTDASYFTKTFRQSFGMTPKEYRASFKEDFI